MEVEAAQSTWQLAEGSALNREISRSRQKSIERKACGKSARLTSRPIQSILRAPQVPKMKTKKAAAKRFRVTGKGRVRRPKAGGNHGMQEKSRKRLRRLRKNDMVHTALEKHIKRLLPYS
jgi:large subunit ribosomal protein L35